VEVTSTQRPVRARIGTWPYRPDVAHLVLLDHQMVPTDADVRSWIDGARRDGARAIRTGALFPNSVGPFLAAGFDRIDELALLERPLEGYHGHPGKHGGEHRIRALRRWQLDAAVAIDVRAFGPTWGNDRAALSDIMHATPFAHARSITVGRTMVGFAMSGVAGRVGYLQRLAVDPARQRHGAGAQLVDDALTWMQHRGATTAMVNTAADNSAALALYDTFGFHRRADSLVLLELRLDSMS
jgi:ribosomal-protein-alanine N-acetyltransferase